MAAQSAGLMYFYLLTWIFSRDLRRRHNHTAIEIIFEDNGRGSSAGYTVATYQVHGLTFVVVTQHETAGCKVATYKLTGFMFVVVTQHETNEVLSDLAFVPTSKEAPLVPDALSATHQPGEALPAKVYISRGAPWLPSS